jgi:formiminotetrahydrofolate cyclodeaminase
VTTLPTDQTLLGDPATGGRAAAIAGAMAAELTRAAARARDWEDGPGAAAQATALVRRMLELGEIGRDAHAEAVRALAGAAAEAPLLICSAAADTALLAATVAEHAEAPVWADAAAAAVLAAGAAAMAAHLVSINLAVGEDDRRALLARDYERTAWEAAARARRAG